MNKAFPIILATMLLTACVPKDKFEKTSAELTTATTELASAREKIVARDLELLSLRADLKTAQTELENAKRELSRKPKVPVRVSFRKAGFGPGYVAVLDTEIKKSFPVLVTVKSRALETKRDLRVDLNWNLATEIGHAEGTPINDGDVVEIKNADYEPISVTFKP